MGEDSPEQVSSTSDLQIAATSLLPSASSTSFGASYPRKSNTSSTHPCTFEMAHPEGFLQDSACLPNQLASCFKVAAWIQGQAGFPVDARETPDEHGLSSCSSSLTSFQADKLNVPEQAPPMDGDQSGEVAAKRQARHGGWTCMSHRPSPILHTAIAAMPAQPLDMYDDLVDHLTEPSQPCGAAKSAGQLAEHATGQQLCLTCSGSWCDINETSTLGMLPDLAQGGDAVDELAMQSPYLPQHLGRVGPR